MASSAIFKLASMYPKMKEPPETKKRGGNEKKVERKGKRKAQLIGREGEMKKKKKREWVSFSFSSLAPEVPFLLFLPLLTEDGYDDGPHQGARPLESWSSAHALLKNMWEKEG